MQIGRRIASRHMPKFSPRPWGWFVWIYFGAMVLGGSFLIATEPIASAIVLGLTLVCYLGPYRRQKSAERERLTKLATVRTGQSICSFALEFDLRVVDPWIVRAVYEEVQRQVAAYCPSFPIRSADRLKEDLGLNDDDLDMDLAVQIQQRTGRSLANVEANPYFGKVHTVGDLVWLFQAQKTRLNP